MLKDKLTDRFISSFVVFDDGWSVSPRQSQIRKHMQNLYQFQFSGQQVYGYEV